MTLEIVYYVSQILAVVGVIGSLLFVGLQMRQANMLARNEVSDRISNAFSDKVEMILSDPELSHIFAHAMNGQSDFSVEEFTRLSLFGPILVNLVRSAMSAKAQRLFEPVAEETAFQTICWFLSKPAFSKVWRLQERLGAHNPAIFEFIRPEFDKRYPELAGTLRLEPLLEQDEETEVSDA
ncbi:hypothetical protein ACFFUB_09040 [Algimonas porphyrae]|uniref:DUF4760 domain-containing protein n=1 Tax=Algimonas porphyrae TaxID=1128113 RepID=A0ABQ5V576_9PROT|nr:hypothetical protein [Algimonas porphyrae]GLQ21741.1 hypothetical protein GCM10007854_26960 [Algimonas porphyrae]